MSKFAFTYFLAPFLQNTGENIPLLPLSLVSEMCLLALRRASLFTTKLVTSVSLPHRPAAPKCVFEVTDFCMLLRHRKAR